MRMIALVPSRATIVALAASGAAFLVMAHDRQLAFGVPLGAVLVAIASAAVACAVARSRTSSKGVDAVLDARALVRRTVACMLAFAAFAVSIASAAHAVVAQPVAGILVTASFVALAVAASRLGDLFSHRAPTPLYRRHGLWLVAVVSVLYWPTLGSASLFDPWETHYGEVAREILSRDDWISTWWSWEGFFYSKPILGIWLQALAMAAWRVHFAAGQMMLGLHGAIAHPEWVVRAPMVVLAIAALYALYRAVAACFGRRAGLLGALVLATSPLWFLVAHETMTDMPLVAPMCASVALVTLAVRAREDDVVRTFELRAGRFALRVSAWHLVVAAIIAAALPQILHLASRNLELALHGAGAHGLRPHLDEFRAGSPGNCSLPGNPACGWRTPAVHFEPALQAAIWASALAVVLFRICHERRTKHLLYLAAWLFASLATLAKGPAGIGLPALAALACIVSTRRYSELLHVRPLDGLLVFAAVALPWYVAMYVRHGAAFTDELIFHDMWNRALSHVHDTNIGDDTSFGYYIRQLGYALFPWTGLAPLGLVAWARRAEGASSRRAVALLLALWALASFALFSVMGTKFHYYIFPAVPPIAMLAGIGLDAMLRARAGTHVSRAYGAAAVAGTALVALVARDLATHSGYGGAPGALRLVQLFTYRYDRAWPESLHVDSAMTAFAVAAAVLTLALAVRAARHHVTGALVALGVAWTAWGVGVLWVRASPHWGQREVLAAYYAERAPDEPLAAYQLNWKGESFYTGNHIAQFGVPANAGSLPTWIAEQRAHGVRVVWFVTEHGRVASLSGEVKPRAMREVTDRRASNQFVLVRAEL
jgi:4-amino-4-deoxy-L-arabinose transferase-like glycosyltransferase